MAKPAIIADQRAPDGGFVPDLCQPRAVLAVVVGAQLLALLLALAQPLEADRFWPRLGLWSLALQWVGLIGTAAAVWLGLLPAGAALLGWLMAPNLMLTALVAAVVLRLTHLRHAARIHAQGHHRARLEPLQALERG